MRKYVVIVAVVLLLPAPVLAQPRSGDTTRVNGSSSPPGASISAVSDSTQSMYEPPYPFIADASFSPKSGAVTMQSIAHGIHRLEDRYLPIGFSTERMAWSKALGIPYSLGKLTFIDAPLDALHDVVRHELFGHGGRLRQAGGTLREIHIDLTPQYGAGGGSVAFDLPNGEFHTAELLSVPAGGLEASTMGAMLLEDRWVRRGHIQYREALHYLTSILQVVGYIGDAGSGYASPGHDVENYLVVLNELGNGYIPPYDAQSLHRKALVEFVNPQLYVSFYNVFWRFLVRGRPEVAFPHVDGFEFTVLPQTHLWLTPHGPEHSFGLKSRGFYPGESLGRGLLLRAGFVWRDSH